MLRFAVVFSLIALPVFAGEPVPPPPQSPQSLMMAQEYADTVGRFDYDAHTVDLPRFLDMAKAGTAVVVDLRSREAYDAGHYEGAKWLGPDVTAEKLAAIAPDKTSTLLLYCQNSLMATRMISLTDVALPQIHALGYGNVFKLDRIWDNGGHSREQDLALFTAEKAD